MATVTYLAQDDNKKPTIVVVRKNVELANLKTWPKKTDHVWLLEPDRGIGIHTLFAEKKIKEKQIIFILPIATIEMLLQYGTDWKAVPLSEQEKAPIAAE